MTPSTNKQYQIRMPKEASDYFDGLCAKYQWAAPLTMTVALGVLERIQKAASAFKVGVTSDGSNMTVFRLPSGEVDVLQEDEASELLTWLLLEVKKGLVGSFAPDQAEHPDDDFLTVLGAYPDSAIGAAMMAIDGMSHRVEVGK